MLAQNSKKYLPYVVTLLFVLIALLFLFKRDSHSGIFSLYSPIKSCPVIGHLPKEDFLDTYVVQDGDTLIEISRDIVGDPERVDELIILNNDRYPDLSLENSMLEENWELVLPPKNSDRTNGHLFVISGRLFENAESWFVRWSGGEIGPFAQNELPENVFEHDCITVIYQGSDPVSPTQLKAFAVIKQ